MPRKALLPGWIGLTVILYLMVWNRESLYLLTIASLCLTVLLVGLLLPWLSVNTTLFAIQMPESDGDDIPEFLNLTVRNRFPWPHDGMLLHIALSATGTSHERSFPIALPRIYPGQRTLKVSLPELPRGRYRLHQATVCATQPFGFWSFARKATANDSCIVVRPHRFPFMTTQWLTGTTIRSSGQCLLGRAGPSSEFFAIREYRPGDSPRHVDWKASARQGQLIVREFEDTARSELLLVVDTHCSQTQTEEGESRFEEGIRLAASVADASVDAGLAVGLMSQNITVSAATGQLQRWHLLEAFTDIQADAKTALHDRIPQLLLTGSPPLTLIIITASSSEGWLRLRNDLPMLSAHGHQIHLVLSSSSSEKAHMVAQPLRPYCAQIRILGEYPVEELMT